MAAEDLAVSLSRPRAAAGNTLLLWVLPAALYYAFLLCAGTSGLFAPAEHGMIFNSMLLHLLHGRFDVDPAAIGDEGYLRDGQSTPILAFSRPCSGCFSCGCRTLLIPT
jgi:hypothetical protein